MSASAPIVGQPAQNQPIPRDQRNLDWLIDQWRPVDPSQPGHIEWEALAPDTKAGWRSALKRISIAFGTAPLGAFNYPGMTAKVIDWRNTRAHMPRSADIGATVLRALLTFGQRYGIVGNITDGIGHLYRSGNRADIVWTPQEIKLFCTAANRMGMRATGDAVRLAAATGLRRGDLVTLCGRHIGPHSIVKKTQKSKKRKESYVTIPRIPSLAALLKELKKRTRQPGVDTVLVDDEGKSWTPDRLSVSVRKIANTIDLMHIGQDDAGNPWIRCKHFHDLRGTFCTNLMIVSDFDDCTIAKIMGWRPNTVSEIRNLYVSGANQAQALGKRIARGLARQASQKNVKPVHYGQKHDRSAAFGVDRDCLFQAPNARVKKFDVSGAIARVTFSDVGNAHRRSTANPSVFSFCVREFTSSLYV